MASDGGVGWDVPAWAAVGMTFMAGAFAWFMTGIGVGKWKADVAGELKTVNSTLVTILAQIKDQAVSHRTLAETVTGMLSRETHAQGIAEGRAQAEAENRRRAQLNFSGPNKRQEA